MNDFNSNPCRGVGCVLKAVCQYYIDYSSKLQNIYWGEHLLARDFCDNTTHYDFKQADFNEGKETARTQVTTSHSGTGEDFTGHS